MSNLNTEKIQTVTEKLTLASQNVERVYAAGYNSGEKSGQSAEYNLFWDIYQENGARRDYQMAFKGHYWDRRNFEPKYDIIFGSGYDQSDSVFNGFNGKAVGGAIDMVALCEERGIAIETSMGTRFNATFRGDGVSRWGIIDLSRATSVAYIFYSNGTPRLNKIEKIISHEGIMWQSNCFQHQTWLKHCIFEGVIGTSITFEWTKYLDRESIVSIVNSLSPTASGKTLTLTRTTVNRAFETSEGADNGIESEEWSALMSTKPNWTISLR